MKHPLHSLCPYFAMFPASFVSEQLALHSRPGDRIFDPFSGRGTTVFQSLMEMRHAWGVDINPVAACISNAKASPPQLASVLRRVGELELQFVRSDKKSRVAEPFFRECFHRATLQQLLFLRANLKWRTSKVDRFVAALALGCLHGESHKTQNCLSNRMPRTISTKPEYSIRWWKEHNLKPPKRDTFEILKRLAVFRLGDNLPKLSGRVAEGDARRSAYYFPSLKKSIDLVITSPPYLDTTDYQEDQWLRLWFLGGKNRPQTRNNPDDRLRREDSYWTFLTEVWSGLAPLVKTDTKIVVRIGATRLDTGQLESGLIKSLSNGLNDYCPRLIGSPITTVIGKRQTDYFRPGTHSNRFEHDYTFALHN